MRAIYLGKPLAVSSDRLYAKSCIGWKAHSAPAHLALALRLAMSLAAVFLALVTGVANAQAVIEGSIMARPINFTKEGTSTACGYRIMVTSTHDGSKGRRILDVLLVRKTNSISLKFDAKKLPKGTNSLESLIPVKTYGGWFKAPGKRPAAILTEIPDGVTPPPPNIRLVDTEGGIEVFDAISRGQPIHVGIRWEPYVENIYVGKVEITQSMIDQFYACVDELKTNLIKQPKRGATS